MSQPNQIRSLINRLARLDAAETWDATLNPAQIAALEYLARANRFSRAPSHVAEYLGTTRGTTSQTLKALARKGYLSERKSETDKRSISYELTKNGNETVARGRALIDVIGGLPKKAQADLRDGLADLLERKLLETGGRPFGICKSCVHHRKNNEGRFCTLLSFPLTPDEADQICHEHAPSP